MKKILLTALLFILSPCAWAVVNNYTPVDNFITSIAATTNYSTNSCYGNCHGISITNTDAYVMQFNLSNISGQTPLHAYLNLWVDRGFQHNLTVYRMLRNFSPSQSTWNIYSTGNNWTTAGALGSGTDFSPTNAVTFVAPQAAYVQVDVTSLVTDCQNAGTTCNLLVRWPTTVYEVIKMAADTTNPPYMTVSTGTPGVPNLWYVRDDGGSLGSTSTTCNGTANVAYVTSMGPNCAVNNPSPILQQGVGVVGGDIVYIDGDSHTAYAFTVSGVTTGPAIGDTYTNNGHTYTVTVPLPTAKASGTITMEGGGLAPSASGTLTRTSGSGDSTIAFSAKAAAQAIYKITTAMTPPGGSPGQQTKIIGTGTNWPQLWDFNVFELIIDTADYIDYENLDITGHDNCIHNGPIGSSVGSSNADGYLNVCNVGGTSNNANAAFRYGGTGKTYTNLLVHNLGYGFEDGVDGWVFGDLTFTNVKIFGVWFWGGLPGGFNGDGNPIMTGTVKLINSQVDFVGCGQRYPLQDSADIFNNISSVGFSRSVDNESNYYNCWGQNQFGYGDAWGFGDSGNQNAGNWTVIGSSVSFNTQDGLDTLHGNGNGAVTVARSRFEGNAGQQIKANGKIVDIENSIINADCQRWVGAPESSTSYGFNNQQGGCPGGNCGFNMYSGDHGHIVCRANGDAIVFPLSGGSKDYIYGNTINSNGITIEPGGGSTCDATTEIHIKNNIINGGGSAINDGNLTIPGGGSTGNEQLAAFIYYDGDSNGNGAGVCGALGNGTGGLIKADEDYNLVYNIKGNNSGCNGAHDVCGTPPGYASNVPMGTPSGAIGTYYTGTAMFSLVPLASSSAARNKGLVTSLIYTQGTNDYNNFTPLALPVVDDGALQYSSTPQSCSGNGITCTTNGSCCSGFCVSGSCAAYNCGDGIVTSPEVGDINGPNLNNQTCILQGFAGGGTLAVNSGCLSFNTSGCSTPTCTANAGSCSTGADCCSGFCSASVCVPYICGDAVITSPEVCDGTHLNNETCPTRGFTSGTLSCASDCLGFDTSGCTSAFATNINLGFSGKVGAN